VVSSDFPVTDEVATDMPCEQTEQSKKMLADVRQFMADHIWPNADEYHEQYEAGGHDGYPPVMEKMKAAARERGLWNLFIPNLDPGAPGTKLTNLEYAPISEELGKLSFASEALNCAAPDTGNMEILNLYGSENVKRDFLAPLLEGEIRSAFSMTEPDVASSDATNISLRIERDGDEYVLNGKKWFSSGALRSRCKVLVVMGKTNPNAPRHLQQSMIVVPRDAKGVSIGRTPHVFGYDHAGGHPEVIYDNVRVPAEYLLGEEGGGFAISQARLGPGRIHHCMRSIGAAEYALELMVKRCHERVAFGRRLEEFGSIRQDIAKSRMEIEQARLLVLKAAHMMDTVGNKEARREIAMIKVIAPNMLLNVLDRAIQAHGGAGVSQDTFLAGAWVGARTLRIADGPDEVHKILIAKNVLRRYHSGEKWDFGN